MQPTQMAFTRTAAPLPKSKRTPPKNVNRTSKYDFAGMKVGESDLTVDFVDAKKAVARLNSAITAYKKRSGDTRRFAVRVFHDAELKRDVLGVWCLEPKEEKAKAAPEAETTATE
jgi:hypothetical protein